MNLRPEAVVFDMDGLLFDTETFYCEALQAAAQDSGHGVTANDALKLVGHPWDRTRQILRDHIGLGDDVDVLIAA